MAREKEQIISAYSTTIAKTLKKDANIYDLQKELDDTVGADKTAATIFADGTFNIIFKETKHSFNLNNGKLLSYKEAYNITGFTESNIEDKAIHVITDAIMEIYLGSTEEKYSDFYNDNNKNGNNYKTSVDNDTIRFFIDENKKLNIIVTLETTIAGYKTSTILTVK